MTVIAAVFARSYALDMFDDLAVVGGEVVPHTSSRDKATGVTTLTFAVDLDPATVTAIRDRMTSRNDDDQAARANLRDLRDAAAEGDIENIRALAVAAIDYWLGGP